MINALKQSVVVLFVFVIFSQVATLAVAAQELGGSEVVIYPTEVQAAGDLRYLGDSLRLMLASRLAPLGNGSPRLEAEFLDERDRGAYRIQLILLKHGNGVALQLEAKRPFAEHTLHLQAQTPDRAGLMQAFEGLVAELGAALFEVDGKTAQVSEESSGKISLATVGTAHPDRILKAGSGLGLSIAQEAFAKETRIEVVTRERYKSAILPLQSRGMTAGDIDGDGKDEILIASNTKIMIYQVRQQDIEPLGSITLPGFLAVHALNVADLDGDGQMEIYLSATRSGNPLSFVMEWKAATGVRWLYENVLWYLRPMEIPGKGLVLMGQRGGVSGRARPGIFQMRAGATGILPVGEALLVPESVNLFDFVYVDLDGDTRSELVTLSPEEQLLVYSNTLKLLYISPRGFGGRERSRGFTTPIRLVVSDFEEDGRKDLILVDNELSSPEILANSRYYKNGQVRGLSWDGKGFIEMWHTNLFKKAVVDFQFIQGGPGSGRSAQSGGRLFVVEPSKGGGLLQGLLYGTGGSRLSVYGMEFVSQESRVAQ